MGNGVENNSPDSQLDLTPRPLPPRRSGRRRILLGALGLLIAGGVAFALVQLLSGASLFFLNVDEALEQRSELNAKRFRLQGTPVANSVTETLMGFEQAVAFSVSFGGQRADVIHVGSAPDLFAPGVPVVLEGRWTPGLPPDLDSFACGANDGYYFASDRMLVKHDNEYRDDYPERLLAADADC